METTMHYANIRTVLSLPFIGSFATGYFSHLFDLSRFATSLFFEVVRQLTINYSLTTCIHQSLLIRSVIRTFNKDFNWFLTCLDLKSFKHFILLFYYFKLGEKEKFVIVYTAEQKFQAENMPFNVTCVRNGNIESAKQVRINIIIVYFIFKIGVGMFSIMGCGPNLQNFQKLLLYQKIMISYIHIYGFN